MLPRSPLLPAIALVMSLWSSHAAAQAPASLEAQDATLYQEEVELTRKTSIDYLLAGAFDLSSNLAPDVDSGLLAGWLLGSFFNVFGGHIWGPTLFYGNRPSNSASKAAYVIGTISTVMGIAVVIMGLTYIGTVVAVLLSPVICCVNWWIVPRAIAFASSDAYRLRDLAAWRNKRNAEKLAQSRNKQNAPKPVAAPPPGQDRQFQRLPQSSTEAPVYVAFSSGSDGLLAEAFVLNADQSGIRVNEVTLEFTCADGSVDARPINVDVTIPAGDKRYLSPIRNVCAGHADFVVPALRTLGFAADTNP